MKGLLLVTVTACVFGAVVAQGQENPQKPAASSNSFSERAPDTHELTSATTGGEQRFTPGVNAAAAVQKNYPAAQAHGNLIDPKSGCALSPLAAIAADSISWSGKCEGGLASGAGTVSFYNDGRFSQSLTAEFEKGSPKDRRGVLVWVDGTRYEGGLAAALMEGRGILTNAGGDRFEGEWRAGLLNGRGIAVWSNGDRYEGEWRDGKANGMGTQSWADGRKYEGRWQDDLPNGHGILTRKDGSRFEGEFRNGRPQDPIQPASARSDEAATHASTAPGGDATQASRLNGAPSASTNSIMSAVTGKKLFAVDGSALTLTIADNAMTREIVAPNRSTRKSFYSFLNDKVGTVAEDADTRGVTGVFRVTDRGVITDFSDGRSETLFLNDGGGLSMTLNTPDGERQCAAWYPPGHGFSLAERQAALAVYAHKLGLETMLKGPANTASGCTALPGVTQSQAADKIAAPPQKTDLRPAGRTAPLKASHRKTKNVAANLPDTPDANEPILVRVSTVHVIDADSTPDEAQSSAVAAADAGASRCLTVESDGEHWDFHNHCAYDVQFAYCLMNDSNVLAGCDRGGVTGSVAANGSSALVMDTSLAEKNVDHDFRWVACGGGAGEVVVHLDGVDPPVGRCTKRGTT